ncbi:MAG: circadian clock KaiB family protein [Spirochaetales bacterium]|nr:circadian clock KaiB family protein [Spirochaetales bacterium]MCF7938366.1 circadian clock KaiB family protein [Spirochaetales bacterium]
MKQNVLKLFITGRTGRSLEAVRNLRALYTRFFHEDYDLVVIDVLEDPGQAETERILATPTLIRRTPSGSRRIIGDLSDSSRVMRLLGAQENTESSPEERK